MIRIGIDGNEANTQNRVGIGQFAFNVISGLEKIDGQNRYTVYLKEPPLRDLPPERDNWNYSVFGPGKLWTQLALPVKLFTQKEKPDVFFSPSHYAPRFSPIPTAISIMDLWHHRHPEQFAKKDLYQLTRWEDYSVKKASHVITISEFSKKEILEVYKMPEEKVAVAYPGFNNYQLSIINDQTKINNQLSIVKKKYGIKRDYFLYIGTLQPKKNIEGLIKAFSFLINKVQCTMYNLRLVVAGKRGWMYNEIFEMVKKLGLEHRVIFTGFICEEEKPYLIAGAKAFVFPSFYEGFGIPVLEAMSLGVPTVISQEGSLPEVGGKAAVYCNPYEAESIAQAMEKILNLNDKQRNEIIKAGLKQSEKFSWEKCARTVLGVLENERKNY